MMAKVARVLVIMMSIESLGAAAGFAYVGDWKLALYWFFVAAINATASTF